MTTLTLTDPDDGDVWELYNVQLSEAPSQSENDITTLPGDPSSDTFVSVLSETESFLLTGLVTAPRLSGTSSPNSYSPDWRTALAEYAQRGEAFAHSSQLTGYTLDENSRGRTGINVVIEDFTWTYEAGKINQLSYELTLRRGEGVLMDSPISVGSATPGSTNTVPTLGGTTLHGFDRLEMTKSIGQLDVATIAFGSSPDDNIISATQGATRQFVYQGRYPAGKTPSQNDFDDTIRNLINDNLHAFSTVFPGYDVTVKVIDFDAERNWQDGGRSHGYSVTMIESK